MPQIVNILKHIGLFLLACAVFLIMRKLIGGQAAGGFPKIFSELYGPSIFVRTGTLNYALPTLMSLILVFAGFAFHRMGKGSAVSGLLFGLSIASIWVFGFMELGGIIPSEAPIRHLKSALRDGTMWTVTGLAAGLLFRGEIQNRAPRERGEWLVIPMTAVLFTIFHGIQFSWVLTELPSNPWRPLGILVQMGVGASAGWMYWLCRPALASCTCLQRITVFTVLGFGVNWVLFTHFYSLFLDWPFVEVTVRCGVDLTAVFFALWLHERVVLPRLATTVGEY